MQEEIYNEHPTDTNAKLYSITRPTRAMCKQRNARENMKRTRCFLTEC
uniref:Uncharacterized protein n=1 Tax=Setaria italica TaxID=4555 RepID=K3Y436_SETIT